MLFCVSLVARKPSLFKMQATWVSADLHQSVVRGTSFYENEWSGIKCFTFRAQFLYCFCSIFKNLVTISFLRFKNSVVQMIYSASIIYSEHDWCDLFARYPIKGTPDYYVYPLPYVFYVSLLNKPKKWRHVLALNVHRWNRAVAKRKSRKNMGKLPLVLYRRESLLRLIDFIWNSLLNNMWSSVFLKIFLMHRRILGISDKFLRTD
jgi:hypothetical protein